MYIHIIVIHNCNIGKPSKNLLSTDLEITKGSDCFDLLYPNRSQHDDRTRNSLSKGIICASNLKRSTSFCSGDSGGPLVCNENGEYLCLIVFQKKIFLQINFKLLYFPFQKTGRAIVYGIVAHTIQSEHLELKCGNTPSFFTNVYFYRGFINNIINPTTSNSIDELNEYEFEYE